MIIFTYALFPNTLFEPIVFEPKLYKVLAVFTVILNCVFHSREFFTSLTSLTSYLTSASCTQTWGYNEYKGPYRIFKTGLIENILMNTFPPWACIEVRFSL